MWFRFLFFTLLYVIYDLFIMYSGKKKKKKNKEEKITTRRITNKGLLIFYSKWELNRNTGNFRTFFRDLPILGVKISLTLFRT